MTENPTCQCGETMDVYHGWNICPHCDVPGCKGGCPNCRKYQYAVNLRLAEEHTTERKKWREDGQ